MLSRKTVKHCRLRLSSVTYTLQKYFSVKGPRFTAETLYDSVAELRLLLEKYHADPYWSDALHVAASCGRLEAFICLMLLVKIIEGIPR